MTETETALYNAAKANLGVHLTLDPSVPPEVGCAECQSKLMQLANIPVPKKGIAGTAMFLAWLETNPDFEERFEPEQGAIIVFATGTGNGKVEGHIGTFAAYNLMYVNDWGVCSNDSNTGTLREQWSYKEMLAYYEAYGGIKPRIFRPL